MASTELGRRLSEGHRQAQLRLSARVVERMRSLWPLLLAADNADGWLDACVRLLRDEFGISAALARQYYDQFRVAEAGLAPLRRISPVVFDEAAARLALTSRGPATLADLLRQGVSWDEAQRRAEAAAAADSIRLVAEGGRSQVIEAVKTDRRAVGWARQTSGRPCAFCAIIAARGPVYKSARGAAFQAHASCTCTVEPAFSIDQEWPGKSREFRDAYDEATKDVRGTRDKINAFRRVWESRDGEPTKE